MPRKFILSKTAEPQALDEILFWHRGIIDSLLEQRASVLYAILAGSPVSPRFVGMTAGDIDVYYDAQRRDLNRLTVLNLVASAEATITVDYFRRVEGKLKDTLAVAYRKWHWWLTAEKKDHPNFNKAGILDVLKKADVMNNHVIEQYRDCLQARHWVAHGRHWAKPLEVDLLTPEDVYDRADALLKALPA